MITNDFENLKLLGFSPITDTSVDGVTPLHQYYKDNMLEATNSYMQKLLEPSLIPTPAPTITVPIQTPVFTLKMLNDVTNKNSTLPKASPYFNIPGTQFNKTTKYSTNTRELGKQIMSFFINKGLTKEQAAGIVGNLHEESKFNTNALGDNKTSYGIAQWHNERWTGLKNFASSRGETPDNLNTQLEYLWHELNTTENAALNKVKNSKSVTEAARNFAHGFERMKTYNPSREHVANSFYNS